LVCYDATRQGEPQRAEELAGLIIKTCVDAGGSITGEHGVGVDKKAYMPAMFSEPDLEAFQRLRCAFDPHGLANPGKVMPTPRLCGEAAAALSGAAATGESVRIVGGGSKQGWGHPLADPGLVIETSALNRIVEHNEGDLTGVLEAGVPLATAQRQFASSGQMLALDPYLGAGH